MLQLQLRFGKIAVAAGMGLLACAGAASQPETQPSTGAASAYFFQTGSRSYLGVDIQDVTAERVTALKLKEERGVEVSMVDQDAPAGKAGIKQHDVILDFNGTAVESGEQLRRLIRETPPGRTVNLGISRDGNPMKISVQLADRGKESTPKVVIPRIPDIQVPKVDVPFYAMQLQTYSSSLGIQTENLSRQLGEYFGVKDGAGVLVRSVEKGSAAEKAGIKAGDVIVRADNEKLTDRADLSHVLRSHREGGKLSLGIMRDRHEQTITVDLPQRGSGESSWPNSEEYRFNWDDYQEEFQKYLDEVRPEVERARQAAALQAYAAAEKIRGKLNDARPAVDRAMRQAEEQLRRAERELKQQDRELRKRIHDMI
jgi:membrane-associated protease RseP (regulator of RpoE activity)